MGDDYRTERVAGTSSLPGGGRGSQQDASRHHHLPAHAYETPAQPAQHSVADAASVLGLPAGQVTAPVLAAVSSLLEELERLRWKEQQSERRQAWLEQLSDRHSVVPCLNRRAFMRELDGFLGGSGQGVVALVQVAGIEALRQLHGLAAGEGALRHVCAHILGAVRSTDLVGCLGGSDFALLLAGADRSHARAKLDEIVEHMKAPPFIWLGQRIPMMPAWGEHVPQDGEGAEQAVAAADRHRRGLE